MEVLRLIQFDLVSVQISERDDYIHVTVQDDIDEVVNLSFAIPKDQIDEFISQLKDW
jgi:hypothetical protein